MPAKELRVVNRGSFFDDAFFKDSWDDFDNAMKNILDGHGAKTENSSRTQCQDMYRQLRHNRIDEDMYASQAVQLTEHDGKFQVVLDVKDFNPRDLQVKVVDERIVLEGRYDKVSDDGKSSSSKAFYREFNLPVEADIDQVSTALSKDGILTIKAPRKEGLPVQPHPEMNTTQASQNIMNALNDHRFGNGSTFKNTKNVTQSSNNYDTSAESFDNLSKDLRERLMYSDKDSGRSTASGSPIPSGFSNTPYCGSPAPSDLGSESSSKASASMEFDTGSRRYPSYQKPEMSFNVGAAAAPDMPSTSARGNRSSFENLQPTFSPAPHTNVSRLPQSSRPLIATGSGGTASVSVKEEDGKRTQTSEKSSLVQEKDGFLESKEVSAEVTEKDSQAVRREATTRMMKHDDDPTGKFKKSEAADASDVSESCVKQMPDGSFVTVKKSSTSTSNFKQSFSSGGQMPSLFNQDFPSRMDDLSGGFMGMGPRGPSLMSQMSSDSLGSNMSAFSDMSNFSRMSDNLSNRPFPRSQGFPNFPDMPPSRSGFSNFQNMNQFNDDQENPNFSTNSSTYSTSSSTHNSSSTSGNRKF